MWNTMIVDKIFCKSMNGNLGRNIACRECKYVPIVNVYFSKNKTLLFKWQKWSKVANLPPGSWLITPGNGAILGTHCWSLPLAFWTLNSDWVARPSLVNVSPCITSIPATTATLFMSQLGNDRGSWRKRRTDIHRRCHPMKWFKILFFWGYPLVSIDMISFWFLPIQRGLSIFLFPRLSSHQFSHCISSKSLIIHPNHCHTSWISI